MMIGLSLGQLDWYLAQLLESENLLKEYIPARTGIKRYVLNK